MSPRHRVAAAMLAASMLTVACDSPTTIIVDPLGKFGLHLTTPFIDDGALLVTLHGVPPGPIEVTAIDGSLVVHSARFADTLRIAVFGPIRSGPLVELWPMRANVASLISIQVEQAASRTNQSRDLLSGYAVSLQRHGL